MILQLKYFILTVLVMASFPGVLNADESLLTELTLEINAVQIVLNDEHRDGIDWEAIVSDFHTLKLTKDDDPSWEDKKSKISVGSVSGEDYLVLLDALDTVGKVTQSSQEPVILLTDVKQTAVISIGDAKTTNEDMRCDLLLTRSPQGDFKLSMEPYVHSAKSQTEVMLKANTVVTLGGIIKEHEITRLHKFPLLGDLPLLGLVFRSKGKLMQKIETVIFLTPHFKAVPSTDENKEDNS